MMSAEASTAPRIERASLQPFIASHTGGQTFATEMERVDGPEALLRLVGRYIYFNSVFGGGVANLAGEIAVRHDLFRDPEEPVAVLADRSVEVASDIFFAAVDEFDDRVAPHRDSHRSLAQATLKGMAAYFNVDAPELDRITRLNPATLTAVRTVQAGYGVNQPVDDAALFRAIGFHLGSEILADGEFDALNRHLRAREPELVRHLLDTTVEIDGTPHAPYFWIQVHTSVEVDHFDAAVRGANTALRFYAGPEPASQPKAWMLEGFAHFSQVQSEFMQGLAEGS